MMKNTQHLALIVAATILGLSSTCFAQVKDQERVIDVSSLSRAIQQATQPIGQRMQKSKLIDRFEDINTILKQDEVDKIQLIIALGSLENEITSFTSDWSKTTDPLWTAQEKIADTVDRVRMLLAQGPTGKISAKAKDKLVLFDRRLTNLAQSIKAEVDPQRKVRLKIVFANILSLRSLTEQTGRINLDPAREALFARMINVLTELEMQLSNACWGVERARVMLTSQIEIIQQYSSLVQDLVDVEILAKELAKMRQSGNALGLIAFNVDELTFSIEEFTANINSVMSQLLTSIEGETAKASSTIDVSTIDDINVDEAIDQYADGKSPSTNSRR